MAYPAKEKNFLLVCITWYIYDTHKHAYMMVDGWIDGWVGGWLNVLVGEWMMDEWVVELVGGWVVGRWINGCVDQQKINAGEGGKPDTSEDICHLVARVA